MLRWIIDLFRRREPLDVYSPRERFIYRYFDGQKEVLADPLLLYRKVMDVWPELSTMVQVAKSRSKDAKAADADMLRTIRELFGIHDLEHGGLTYLETIDLLDHFMTFATTVKKNMSTPPSTSTPTETPAPSSGDAQATKPSSGSGSTGETSFSGEPAASPTASVSP